MMVQAIEQYSPQSIKQLQFNQGFFIKQKQEMRGLIKLVLMTILLVIIHSGYNPKEAKPLAYMSLISYDSLSSINQWSCDKCSKYPMKSVKADTVSTADLQWFSGYLQEVNGIVLVFRGSSSIQSWIINLSVNLTSYPKCSKCQVHLGFYTAWQLIYNQVLNRINSLRSLYRNAPIYVTGHSLGGALASLAVVDMHHLYGSVHSLITFGQPRVGNEHFSEYFKSIVQSYRVIHKADVVPHIPLTNQGFFHEGRQVWYKSDMDKYEMCSYGEPGRCSNSLPLKDLNSGDHDMHKYIKLSDKIYVLSKLKEIALKVARQKVKKMKKNDLKALFAEEK